MKKFILGSLAALLLSVSLFGQSPIQQGSPLHKVGGLYFSVGYNTWNSYIVTGNTSTGASTSITVTSPGPLQDGSLIPAQNIFTTSNYVLINDANAETFLPSAVSFANCPVGTSGVSQGVCATLTGTINNTHGTGAVIASGSAGIGEAMSDAAAHGGGLVYWEANTGNVTLSLTGLTTTTTTYVPTTYYQTGAAAIVETTITGLTAWEIGVSGATTSFTSANSTLTAGTTAVANQVAPAHTGTTQALTAVLITATVADATAGVVKAKLWGWTPVQPGS